MRLLLLLFALCALAHSARVRRSPSVPAIKVHHEYTVNFENGTCWSSFGYANSLESAQTVAAGFPQNFFYPKHAAPSRLPITTFAVGLQTFAMNVTWQCQRSSVQEDPQCLIWNLATAAAGGGSVLSQAV